MADKVATKMRGFRLSDADMGLVRELGEHFARKENDDLMDCTTVVRRAIRRLHAAEIGQKKIQKKVAK